MGIPKRGWFQVGSGLVPLGSCIILLWFSSKRTWCHLVQIYSALAFVNEKALITNPKRNPPQSDQTGEGFLLGF